MMNAVMFRKYGSPKDLTIEKVPKPTPKSNQVLVKVMAAAVNPGDFHIIRADPFPVRFMFGLFRPKINILGSDVAGVVEAVGDKVTKFKPGDAVFGDISGDHFGAFAEYVCVDPKFLHLKPGKLSFEQAAALPLSGGTALQAFRKAQGIKRGDKVLVNGATGGIGSLAVQIAKARGAEVTAVCSGSGADAIQQLGADKIIDYKKQDFTKTGERYNVIIDTAASKSISALSRAMAPGGRYVLIGGGSYTYIICIGGISSLLLGKTFKFIMASPQEPDLPELCELADSDKLRPMIEKIYPLADVSQAILHVEAGHAKGKSVIKVSSD